MTNIILCGGSGTRLWPISRTLMPKQFVKLFDDESLFQLTVKRNQKVWKQQLIERVNESTYIPMGEVHRLENMGKIPLVMIEAQVGEYLGEDDIVRLDDDFKRIVK